EHVARDRRDERQHHDGEDQAGGEHPDAVGRAGEQRRQDRHIAEQVYQERLQRLLQEGGEDEETPNAVDEAGNAGQELDRNADRPAQKLRAQLGQKHGDEKTDRNRDQHGDEGGDKGAVDRGERAEALGDRIPPFLDEEIEAERLQRRHGADDQGEDDAAKQAEN